MKKTKDKYSRCLSCEHSCGEGCKIVPQRRIRENEVPCTAYQEARK